MVHMQSDPVGTILYSLVVRDPDEGTNGEITFTINSPVSANNHILKIVFSISAQYHMFLTIIIFFFSISLMVPLL